VGVEFDFAGKALLLTGASGGIGSAVVKLFHDAGASVLLADIDGDAATALAHSLDPGKKRTAALQYDAASAEHAEAAVELCLQRFGRLDYLVSAAALYEDLPFLSMTDEQWRRSISVNLDGVFYLCRRAIPRMEDNGAVVLIASQSAHEGSSVRHSPYGASKGGVLLLARSLARELAPRIRINAVSPGFIDTPMAREAVRLRGAAALERTPMGRMGTPREAAESIAFLCSDASTYITGQTIHINGGAYMGG